MSRWKSHNPSCLREMLLRPADLMLFIEDFNAGHHGPHPIRVSLQTVQVFSSRCRKMPWITLYTDNGSRYFEGVCQAFSLDIDFSHKTAAHYIFNFEQILLPRPRYLRSIYVVYSSNHHASNLHPLPFGFYTEFCVHIVLPFKHEVIQNPSFRQSQSSGAGRPTVAATPCH